MEGYKVLGSSSLSCRVASAAMAMVTAKTEANYHMVGFSNKLVPIQIHARMPLDEVCRTISKVSLPSSTSLQLPSVFIGKHEAVLHAEFKS